MKDKKLPFITKALIVIVGLSLFFELKDRIFAGKVNIITSTLFSCKGYAKNIEIKSYILTKNQVIDFFKDITKEPRQLTDTEISDKCNGPYSPNLVLYIKNLGKADVWGTLSYCFNGCFWYSIDILALGKKNETLVYVIPLGSRGLDTTKDDFPKVKVKWKCLYKNFFKSLFNN